MRKDEVVDEEVDQEDGERGGVVELAEDLVDDYGERDGREGARCYGRYGELEV